MISSARFRRWELYWTDLDPSVGSEQAGAARPVLIVSSDGFNQAFTLVTVLPLTRSKGKRRKVYPFEVLLPAGMAGNRDDSIIMPQQIRTISKLRLQGRIGALADPDLQSEVENRLLEHLDIEFEPEVRES